MRKITIHKLTIFFVLSLLLLCPAIKVYAASPVWTNQDTDYSVIIDDEADLLSEEEESLLALTMRQVTAYGHAAFKSVSSNSYSTSYFAEKYYHELFGSQSGTLFLIDMDNREIYLFSDGAIYRVVTSSYAYTITDNVYRYASSSNYYLCANEAFSQIHTLLSGHKIAQPMKYISNTLLALILAALINYFIAILLSGTAKPSKSELLSSISTGFKFTDPYTTKTHQTKVYSPQSSGSSSGSSGGSSHSSGGGGGGHSSGGGGGHRF